MTTTPFEERPDAPDAPDAVEPADVVGGRTGAEPDVAEPDRDLSAADGPPEDLLPDSTPFRVPGTNTD